jgi:phage FluMu gp28-like protein
MPHQVKWIQAEKAIHNQRKQAMALAEKSVRIGWTYADAFKNVRKRLWFKDRDYLFATKDYPSALEYVRQCYKFAEIFNLTSTILSHDEEDMTVNQLDAYGHPSGVVETVKVGVIKFDNGSRILAFSSNPQAMAAYGGDVGLDEFAKHPNAKLLWETAQGRVALGHDLALWSAHDGEDTLFNEFAQEARAGVGPWNIYYKVTMPDAIQLGLVDVINRAQGTRLTPEKFLAGCKARARQEEIYEQAYLCNPLGASTNHIVDWSVIERCRYDYEISRVHLEHSQIIEKFGEFIPNQACNREHEIGRFLLHNFNKILTTKSRYRLGFDVAASGQGDLAVIYIDEAKGDELSLRALFTCRTEDWHFLKTVIFYFLRMLRSVKAAGDETGLGKQICWEAASSFGSVFSKVNFSGKKHDLGLALMNQLAIAQKRFPASQHDIAADYFALRKSHSGTRWVFSEARNTLNSASHCDIAWAGALASHAHTEGKGSIGCAVLMEGGTVLHSDRSLSREQRMILSDDPAIWRRVA